MPDVSGKLSSVEKQKVADFLRARSKGPIVCPICKEANWFIGDHVVWSMGKGEGQAFVRGGQNYPEVMVILNRCGYTMLVNAVMAGILPGS